MSSNIFKKEYKNGSIYHINFGRTFHPELKSKHLGILYQMSSCYNMMFCLPMTSPKEKHFKTPKKNTMMPRVKEVNVDYVASIGDVKYENIDDAIEEANSGDVIVLLANVRPTKTFYKDLTFRGKYTITYNVYGWRFNGNITVDGATLIINSLESAKAANNGEVGKWFSMVLGGTLKVQNYGKIEFNYDSNYGVNCAILSE